VRSIEFALLTVSQTNGAGRENRLVQGNSKTGTDLGMGWTLVQAAA